MADLIHPSFHGISVGQGQFSFDARQIVEVIVEAFGREQGRVSDVGRRIPHAVTLGAGFVLLCTDERAGAGGASRAAVSVRVDVARLG